MKNKRIQIRVTSETHEDLVNFCKRRGWSISTAIRIALADMFLSNYREVFTEEEQKELHRKNISSSVAFSMYLKGATIDEITKITQ